MASAPPPRGDLFVVSAPSGAGKTTIIRRLLESADFGDSLYYSVSHTTRCQRPGEVDGRDYHFVDVACFERMIDEDAFLEWADVHGQRKGTSKAPILDRLARGTDVLIDIDVKGAAQVRARYPDAVSIFIMPPSFEELRRRLRARDQDSEAQMARRLANARHELQAVAAYDYVMINERVEDAVGVLDAVIQARRNAANAFNLGSTVCSPVSPRTWETGSSRRTTLHNGHPRTNR